MKTFGKLILALCLSSSGVVVLADKLPEVSHDGLHLMQDTKVQAAYMKPGADLGEYDKVAILDTYVAFRKNWQRDHNRDEVDPERRVTDKEMEKIREELASEFNKVFVEVLSAKGGHEVVEDAGQGVLILRPAIINLDIAAPDTMSPGMGRTFTTATGQMTLYLELYDGVTQDIIARIIDPEVVGDEMGIQWANRVTNKAEADRVLRRWATLLNDHLAEVKSGSSS
jgi:hypothetical protein